MSKYNYLVKILLKIHHSIMFKETIHNRKNVPKLLINEL